MSTKKSEAAAKKMLDAAKQIVHTEGHQVITVRRVAQLSGYTYPLLYHYFRDLDSLLWTLRLSMIEDMMQELRHTPDESADPVEELRRVFQRYMGYFFDHPNVYRFFYFHAFSKPSADDGYRELENKLKQMQVDSFAKLAGAGSAFAHNTEMIAKTVIYAIQGIVMLALSSNGDLDKEKAKEELDALISYLLADARGRA